jgi:hypothetical protein
MATSMEPMATSMEPDAATLAELKQQCKTWGWDFAETLAEWKQQNKTPVLAHSSKTYKTSSKTRTNCC